jgi:hypothetical protein
VTGTGCLEELIVTTVIRDAMLASFHSAMGASIPSNANQIVINTLPDPTMLLRIPRVHAGTEHDVLYPGRVFQGWSWIFRSASRFVRQFMGIIDGSMPNEPSRVNFIDADRGGRDDVVQLVAGLTSTHLLAFARFVSAARGQDPVLTDPRTLPFLEQALADGIRSGVRAGLLRVVIGQPPPMLALPSAAPLLRTTSLSDCDRIPVMLRSDLRRVLSQ